MAVGETHAQNATDKTVESNTEQPISPAAPPRAYSSCSKAFQSDLKLISEAYVKPLRNSIVAGRKRSKSLPRALTYRVPREKRSKALSKAISYAQRAVRNQGADPWLRTDGGRWLTDSISIGLKRFAAQPESPFVCTGVDGYLGYMEPQIKKMTPINKASVDHKAAAFEGISDKLDDAYYAMRPTPLPVFAIRPWEQPALPEDTILREGNAGNLPVQNTSDREVIALPNDEVVTGSVKQPENDPDLPALSERAKVIPFESITNTSAAIGVLYRRALETGTLPAGTVNPVLGTGGDPAEILQNTKAWVVGKSALVNNANARLALNAAFSRIEILNAIEVNAYALTKVEAQMRASFEAIRTAHIKKCTCE